MSPSAQPASCVVASASIGTQNHPASTPQATVERNLTYASRPNSPASQSLIPSPSHGPASSGSENEYALAPVDIEERKREHVLDLTLALVGHCPLCFVRRSKPDVHWAYRCPSALCGTSPNWNAFKTGLRLGPTVCPRCAPPSDAPCNHPPLPANRSVPTMKCDYNDLLK